METLDTEACHRALSTRDARFDGRFFTAVKTTGVYCRPICPARAPKRENCLFFPSAAAAEGAGFRACLRCRPEAAPDLAVWRGTSNTVSRALQLITDGALDGEDACVDVLAGRLGVGERQLRRLFRQHLGASPIAVAQTRRLLFAKALIQETRLPMTEVALASGFGSVRRFNDAFQAVNRRTPSAIRRGAAPANAEAVTLRIAYRAPYDWDAMLAHLETRALSGIEAVADGRYRRTFALAAGSGAVEVRPAPGRDALLVSVRTQEVRVLSDVVARVRRVFDVAADVDAIAEHLSQDATLGPLIAARPGLRAPGGWDGFELAVRAMLGQQVTIVAARRLGAALVTRWGAPLPAEITGAATLIAAFPTPERLAHADLTQLGMPPARAAAISGLAAAVQADPGLLRPGAPLEIAVARLKTLPGVGDWTAQYVALRALRDPDAFPAGDVALQRALSGPAGRPDARALLARAEAWRPWRAYAAQHLWAADAAAAPKRDAA